MMEAMIEQPSFGRALPPINRHVTSPRQPINQSHNNTTPSNNNRGQQQNYNDKGYHHHNSTSLPPLQQNNGFNNNNNGPRKLVPGGLRNSSESVKIAQNQKFTNQELVKKNQEEFRNLVGAYPKTAIQEAQEKDGWFVTPVENYHKNFLLPCLPVHLIKNSTTPKTERK